MRLPRTASLGLVILTTASASSAEPPPDALPAASRDAHAAQLGLLAGAGNLGSPGASGGAFLAGLRLGLGSHFAGSADLGYGLLSTSTSMQDRWWLIPAAAFVVPAGPVRFDFGAGAGIGTSSGYASWVDYAARPFTPTWHFTVPAVRAHVTAAFALTRDLDVFARVDAASLLAVAYPESATNTTWFALWVGVEPRLL